MYVRTIYFQIVKGYSQVNLDYTIPDPHTLEVYILTASRVVR